MPQTGPGLVLIPSYNSGIQLAATVRAALALHQPVLVVLDGSTDASGQYLEQQLGGNRGGWHLLRHQTNSGKGACVLTGLAWAQAHGFSHALVMDADGQHPADAIPEFLRLASENPGTMVLGTPVFGPDAPRLRVYGRLAGNFFTRLATLGGDIRDSLFGFRCYPVQPTLAILRSIRTARRFDFDTEMVVRLYWRGIRPLNRPVPVFYPPRSEGGISHFRYLRDNLLLTTTHTRLFFGMLIRLPTLVRLRLRHRPAPSKQRPVRIL